MNERLVQALNYVEDGYIAEAVKPQSRRWRKFLAPIAAILALVLIVPFPSVPVTVSAQEISTPTANRMEDGLYWRHSQEVLKDSCGSLADFTDICSAQVLMGTDDANRIWSPVSAYIAMGIAAELSEGTTRQELLDALDVPDIDALRERITSIWENLSASNEEGEITFANSLWLDDSLSYDQARMDAVSYHYYAPVLQQDLDSASAGKDVSNWLNLQTNGNLHYNGDLGTQGNNALTLISTLYFQSDWTQEFDPKDNTVRTFHGNSADYPRTFMFQKLHDTDYFWDEDFSAIRLGTENSSCMWLILPDEDKTVDQVLSSGRYMDMILDDEASPWENVTEVEVRLYLPKFTITGSVDLKGALQKLGVQKAFDPYEGEYSQALESSLPVFLNGIRQSTRVEVNEYGVIAAGYTELDWGYGASAPKKEWVEMVFDRPFLFVIVNKGVPLFAGAVNHP